MGISAGRGWSGTGRRQILRNWGVRSWGHLLAQHTLVKEAPCVSLLNRSIPSQG